MSPLQKCLRRQGKCASYNKHIDFHIGRIYGCMGEMMR